MRTLGIECSCDDTAFSVVEDGHRVLASVRRSQTAHSNWGGVVPELAARLHAESWREVLADCLQQACVHMDEIDEIAVTAGPGLMGSLLVGSAIGGSLSALYDIPLRPVQHIWGHVFSVALGRTWDDLQMPALCLTVSGGHTQLLQVTGPVHAQLISQTRDDSAGEAFDKVARALGLGYPGGPIISQMADAGDPTLFAMPHPLRHDDDFSFSGLKAATIRHIENISDPLTLIQKQDLCAAFQQAIVEIFVRKVTRALAKLPGTRQLWFVGGVSANRQLRSALYTLARASGIELLMTTDLAYCTDNAAMICAAAHMQRNNTHARVQALQPDSRLGL